MICKCCGSRLYCKNSRPSKRFSGAVWRRYICPGCDTSMYTIETEELDYSKRKYPDEELKAELNRLKKQVQEYEILLYQIRKLCKDGVKV